MLRTRWQKRVTRLSEPGREPQPASQGDATRAGSLRVLLALVIGQLGMHSAMAGLRMAAPLQALREGYSAWAVGVLLALFAAAPVVLALHAGRYADRHGYHLPVYASVTMVISGMALAVLAHWASGALHFALLCVAAMLTGSGANMGMLAIQRTAALAARDHAERVRLFSWLGVAPSLSNVIGPVMVGFIIDAGGFVWAYATLMLLPLVTLISARQVPHLALKSSAAGADRTAWDLLAAPNFRRLLAINWLLSMCWDVHSFAVPILGHERGFSATTIGLVLGTFTLSVTGVRLVIPWIAHRLNELYMMRAAMIGTGCVFALYPLAHTPLVMAACAALLGLTLGSVQPMIMGTLYHLTPDQRHGEALALRSMAMNTSSTVMPLVFGVLGSVIGAGVLFWLVGGSVGSGALLTRRLRWVRT
jgi:MFS family permease